MSGWRRVSEGRAARWIAWGVIVLSAIVLVDAWPTEQILELARAHAERLGPWGPLAIMIAYVILGLLFIPGTALTIAAGALFGFWMAVGMISLASTIVAALAFLAGRHLARERVRRWIDGSVGLQTLDRAVERGGWKMIVLLRLSPAIPFSLGNYLYGMTELPFLPHIIASWLTMLPGIVLYASLGVVGRRAGMGDGDQLGPAEWVLAGIGILAMIVVSVWLARIARTVLRERTGTVARSLGGTKLLLVAAIMAVLAVAVRINNGM